MCCGGMAGGANNAEAEHTCRCTTSSCAVNWEMMLKKTSLPSAQNVTIRFTANNTRSTQTDFRQKLTPSRSIRPPNSRNGYSCLIGPGGCFHRSSDRIRFGENKFFALVKGALQSIGQSRAESGSKKVHVDH